LISKLRAWEEERENSAGRENREDLKKIKLELMLALERLRGKTTNTAENTSVAENTNSNAAENTAEDTNAAENTNTDDKTTSANFSHAYSPTRSSGTHNICPQRLQTGLDFSNRNNFELISKLPPAPVMGGCIVDQGEGNDIGNPNSGNSSGFNSGSGFGSNPFASASTGFGFGGFGSGMSDFGSAISAASPSPELVISNRATPKDVRYLPCLQVEWFEKNKNLTAGKDEAENEENKKEEKTSEQKSEQLKQSDQRRQAQLKHRQAQLSKHQSQITRRLILVSEGMVGDAFFLGQSAANPFASSMNPPEKVADVIQNLLNSGCAYVSQGEPNETLLGTMDNECSWFDLGGIGRSRLKSILKFWK
jgi:hypothetical protein